MDSIVRRTIAFQAGLVALFAATGAGADPPGPPADPVSDARLTAPLDRKTLLRAVVARSPAVRASEQRALAMRSEAKGEGSLPPPEAMAQVWQVPFSKPYALDTQMIMFGVTQEFPSPGARGAREDAMIAQAQGEEAMAGDRARQARREAGYAFADYSESSAKYRLHRTQAQITRHLLDVARARHAAGGSLADAARAEVELSRIDAEVMTDANLVSSAKARINAMLGRGFGSPLGDVVETEPETPAWETEALLSKARAARPELRAARSELEARRHTLRAASREATWPSFTLGALYFPPTQMISYHGYGATASATLPWLWGGAGDRRTAQEHFVQSAASNVQAAQIAIDAEVASASTIVQSAAQRLQMLRGRTLPAGRQAFEIVQAGYESGRADMLAVLEARRTVLEIQQDVLMARTSLDRALTDLEAAVGAEVPTRPLAPLESTPSELPGGGHGR
jgi:outer membrane protein TolC